MAQVTKQSIVLGGGRIVGTVSVDGGAVRADGGPIRPQLIVPVTIQMNPQPDEAMIAIVWLFARLGTDQNASPHQAICQPISQQLVTGFHAHSLPHGTTDHTEYLRFYLSAAEVEDIERRRQAAGSDVFTLYLGLDPIVAGMKSYNSFGPGKTPEPTPWNLQFGLFSQVLPFWTSQVSPVMVQIEQSTWVRNVLPALGYDRLRLLELTFPPPLPGHANAASQFDKAKRALDERRYGDCIQECRGLLNMWEKQFGATGKQNPLANVVASDRGWPENDIRRAMLDTLWKEIGDIANAPHHPEGNVDSELFSDRDARLILLLTAALSEYVERR